MLEQSLSSIEGVIGKVKVRINQTDEQILRAVRDQANIDTKGRQNLNDAQIAIQVILFRHLLCNQT